jgi:excisionase family DNA binding protein
MLEEFPAVLTVADVQKILRIGRCAAYEIVNTPGFPAKRIGRTIRIPRKALEKWLNDCWTEEEKPKLKIVQRRKETSL